MRRANIEVIHESTVISEADVHRAIKALQRQVREDFAPAWGFDAELRYAKTIEAADPDAWHLILLDEKNEDDGYHELTKRGNPLGKVFVKVAIADSGGWTSTASHELLELLADPDMSHTLFVETNAGPRVYEIEVCDPCQDDRHAYRIDGELVSDFIYPSWFEFFGAQRAAHAAREPLDHMRHIGAPYEVLEGGYASYYDVHARAWRSRGPGKAGWVGVWGGASDGGEGTRTSAPAEAHAATEADANAGPRRGGSRRQRRPLPRLAWRPSER